MNTGVESSSRQKADELIRWFREYAEKFLNLTLADERRSLPPNVFMDLGNKGFFGLNISKEYGGLNLDKLDFYRVIEQIGGVDISLGLTICLHTENGMGPILKYGNENLKKELLPKMATGRYLGSIGLTEPSFGTNFLDMKTTAVHGKDWVINGLKRWNSSNWAQVVNVFAVSKDDQTRDRGLTGFTILKSMKGVHSGEEALTLGLRSIMQNSLILDNVHVSNEYVLGEPHKGFTIIDNMLSDARVSLCFGLIGAMKRAVQIVHRFLTVRRGQSGKLIEYPYLLDKLDHILCSIAAVENFAIHAVKASDKDILPNVISILLKVAASEFAMDNIKQCMLMAGGRGYMENNNLARYMKDVYASYYGEGSNDSLLSIAGNEILYKNGFSSFLESNFKMDELYTEFTHMLDKIREKATGDQAQTFNKYVYPYIAQLALSLILYYASLGSSKPRTSDWARLQFKQNFKMFNEVHLAKNTYISDAEVTETVHHFADDIGDIEFKMSGEDRTRDPYL